MRSQAPAQAEQTKQTQAHATQAEMVRQPQVGATFEDNRPEAAAQRRLVEMMNISPHAIQRRASMEMIDNSPRVLSQKAFANKLNNGPRMTGQHRQHGQHGTVFSGAAQRMATHALVQRKTIGALKCEPKLERKQAIVAAWCAIKTKQTIEEAWSGQQALEGLGVENWEEVDIPDDLFGVIDDFLLHSPAFYVPTTAAIWVGFIERILQGRGKLRPPDKIDLTKQEPDEEVEKLRATLIKSTNYIGCV